MDLIDRAYGFSPYDVHIASYLGPFTGFPEFPAEARGVGATAFLKAPVGTIRAIHPVDDLTDEEIADYREHVDELARFRTGQLFSVTAESE
jgi:hypothetical protein